MKLHLPPDTIEMSDLKTRLAQAGHYLNPSSGGIVPPIDPSVTFARDENLELVGNYVYGRYQNPTHDQVELLACELENGKRAKLFSSGLAAAAAVFDTVCSGEHIIAPSIMYHGAQDWLHFISDKRYINLTLFDPKDLTELASALEFGAPSVVWIESPVNPSFDVIDIEKASELAHEAGAILVVDCTVAPPVTTRALDFGADIVFHSATKYLNGHSDLNAGLLVTREITKRWEEIESIRRLTGSVLGSFDAWLLLRGMRTLALRFERASENAMKIAQFLEQHDKIETVMYPGLPSHSTHSVAKKQMRNGYGGMMSVCLKGGAEAAKKLTSCVKIFMRATSLGGVESLIEHRRTVEGPNSQVPIQLVRLSIGIESADDLIADLKQALDQV